MAKARYYKALSGDAGIVRYQVMPSAIAIEFKDHAVYLYDYPTTGRGKVETMKRLAEKGDGLTTYINQHVRGRYAAKMKRPRN